MGPHPGMWLHKVDVVVRWVVTCSCGYERECSSMWPPPSSISSTLAASPSSTCPPSRTLPRDLPPGEQRS